MFVKQGSDDQILATILFIVHVLPKMFSETQFSVLFSSNTLLCYRLHALMFPSLERIQAKTKQSATHSMSPITGSVYWSGLEQCILLVVHLIPLQLKGMPQPFFTFCHVGPI